MMMFEQNSSLIFLEKPKLNLNVHDRQKYGYSQSASQKTAPSNWDKPRTAPALFNNNNNRHKSSVVKVVNLKDKNLRPTSAKTSNYTNLHTRKSIKEKQILDWAFKKFYDEQEARNSTKINSDRSNNSAESKSSKDSWYDDDVDDLIDSNYKNKINLSDYDDIDAENEFLRKYRNTTINNKNDMEKTFQAKLLDAKLLDLSKERHKILNLLEYQKKLFIRKQLFKAKSLPGLRCVALVDHNSGIRFQPKERNKSRPSVVKEDTIIEKQNKTETITIDKKPYNNPTDKVLKSSLVNNQNSSRSHLKITFKTDSPRVKQESIAETQKTVSFNETKDTVPSQETYSTKISANQASIFPTIKEKKSIEVAPDTKGHLVVGNNNESRNSTLRGSVSGRLSINTQSSQSSSSLKTPTIDYRFNNLITLVKPSYMLSEMKDVSKIIEQNEALKSTNLTVESREKFNKVKQNGSKLAITARKIIASGDYISI